MAALIFAQDRQHGGTTLGDDIGTTRANDTQGLVHDHLVDPLRLELVVDGPHCLLTPLCPKLVMLEDVAERIQCALIRRKSGE